MGALRRGVAVLLALRVREVVSAAEIQGEGSRVSAPSRALAAT